jgi:acylphosphatase
MHYNIEVQGKVQGVFFRASTKEAAQKLGIKGFVQNMGDGSVYIEAEGDKTQLDKLVSWCHEGPAGALVLKVGFSEGEGRHFDGFEIRH